MHPIRLLLLPILLALLTLTQVSCRKPELPASPAAPSPVPAWQQPGAIVGEIVEPDLKEASGLAPSRRRDDLLWVLNDSGNPPELFGVATNGALMARHPVAGVGNRDWEDLASFVHEEVPYLLVAEVGDNNAQYAFSTLNFLEEPEVPAEPELPGPPLTVVREIRFSYEDGPRDCESVAVDVPAGKVLLLTKRDTPPVLYELPLFPDGTNVAVVARRVGVVTSLPQPTEEDLQDRFGRYWAQPTALDISPDGRTAAILTYKNAYVFERAPDQSWLDALAGVPRQVELPHPGTQVMRIREALAFSRDAASLFVTSERIPAPLFLQEGVREK
jgi:hypothetical protein